MDKQPYYKGQLGRIDTMLEYAPIFQFKTLQAQTNWLTLNHDSAVELILFLEQNYPAAYIEARDILKG